MKRLLLCLIIFSLFPVSAFANESESRRDVFLKIWETLRRPHYETATRFEDLNEGDEGFEVISYAKRRGILDDEEKFFPDENARVGDSLVWLFRSRNVAYPDDVTLESLSGFVEQYGLIVDQEFNQSVHKSQIDRWIEKLDKRLSQEVHEVSYYADDFHGKGTAFGETFDMYAFTAAHRTLPHNTLVAVTNVDNGKSVVVRINDRGPFVEGRDMDLSLAAFEAIAPRGQGILNATFTRLGDSEMVDPCSGDSVRYQKRITKNVRFHRGVPHKWYKDEAIVLGANRVFVVRGVTNPDGSYRRIQDFVYSDEVFVFIPEEVGEYKLWVGTGRKRLREMRVKVSSCSE